MTDDLLPARRSCPPACTICCSQSRDDRPLVRRNPQPFASRLSPAFAEPASKMVVEGKTEGPGMVQRGLLLAGRR